MTITRVAESLGVDRKTVANHVGDRPTLRRLVASEAVAAELAHRAEPTSLDWREALVRQADAMVQAVIEVGVADIEFGGSEWELTLLGVAENSLGRLLAAGFDADTAVAAVSVITDVATNAARRILRARQRGQPELTTLPRMLADSDPAEFSAVRQVIALAGARSEEARYRQAIDLCIRGLDAAKSRLNSTPTEPA
ncbi:hypothetical protein Q9S36_43535 [Microbacterium sp. ARD31]|uniref:hypothetical protein n=1 Tax=Microbacterium sp. ARD31 TaxID=2962576 RepID=UPI002882222C|nr:hypothetical protein [Microbacterium sp. ARD31]MDT0187080.1 hypothetical protein [Microbacterium sp. ARD31]